MYSDRLTRHIVKLFQSILYAYTKYYTAYYKGNIMCQFYLHTSRHFFKTFLLKRHWFIRMKLLGPEHWHSGSWAFDLHAAG